MAQYLHLISNTTASNPLDVWNPSSKNIKPQLADQYTIGFFKDLGKNRMYELSVEGYWKNTQNQIDYIDGADLLINEFLEGDLLSGEGRSYGVETYFQKKAGRLTGWVSYTLARTELKVNGINQGDWYRTRFDQAHNLKIAAFYDISKRWSFSANFVYTSGTPTTFPTSRYISQGLLVPYNGNDSRNNVTLPDYHRLDVSFRLEGLLGLWCLQLVCTTKPILDLFFAGRPTSVSRPAYFFRGHSAFYHRFSGAFHFLQL
jgi:hypothetical protein